MVGLLGGLGVTTVLYIIPVSSLVHHQAVPGWSSSFGLWPLSPSGVKSALHGLRKILPAPQAKLELFFPGWKVKQSIQPSHTHGSKTKGQVFDTEVSHRVFFRQQMARTGPLSPKWSQAEACQAGDWQGPVPILSVAA